MIGRLASGTVKVTVRVGRVTVGDRESDYYVL